MKYRVLFSLFFYSSLFATPFKIASYNVQNLFDLQNNGTEYKEYIPFTHNWNKKTKEIKLNHIAEVICDIEADIIGLQEIENNTIFIQLKNRLQQVGCGYKYYAISHKRGSSIQVALLSNFKITHSQDIKVSSSPRVRNILEVTLLIKKKKLTVFVNHWKSKAYNGVESKRILYAKALQKRIKEIDFEYIVLGDFNSNYNESFTMKKKLNDTDGKTAINHILKTLYQNELVDKFVLRYSGVKLHYNLWQELAFVNRWSYSFYGKKSTLDAIILPYSLFDGKNIDYIANSFGLFKPSYLFTKQGYINRWRYKNKKHLGLGYSDHLAVYASFSTQPYRGDFTPTKHYVSTKNIEDLYQLTQLPHKIALKRCAVIFKRGNSAIIKQKHNKRGIYLYGCATHLKEGYSYDLTIENITSYHGLKEITHISNSKKIAEIKITDFMHKNLKQLQQNEVVQEIEGIYKNRFFYANGKKISIYFKNRKLRPKNHSRLKIKYAHIGYYKKLQLVIYSKKDFEIME